MNNLIYMDNAATTPIKDSVLETMKYALHARFQNPSSPYSGARENKRTLELCRCQIAELINADPTEIYFTSGGTESDNWALKGIKYNICNNIITTAIEHDAIYETAQELAEQKVEVRVVNPNCYGLVEKRALLNYVDENTKLVSCMYINNETGVIQPIDAIGKELRKEGIIFHTDAVQAFGHIPIDVLKLNVDMLSVSAHKFGGPKGIGFLYVRNMTKLNSFIKGGHQEKNMRAGTENLPAIMGMTVAAKESIKNMKDNYKKIVEVSGYMQQRLVYEIDNVEFNGSDTNHYPGIINFTFKNVPSEQLVELLNENKICVSSGSACNTGSGLPSRVLTSMGRTEDEANCAVRISLSENNTIEEAKFVVDTIKEGVNLIRG